MNTIIGGSLRTDDAGILRLALYIPPCHSLKLVTVRTQGPSNNAPYYYYAYYDPYSRPKVRHNGSLLFVETTHLCHSPSDSGLAMPGTVAQRPSLPTELLDIILDELDGDLETQKPCSLVCPTWLDISRHHVSTSCP